MTRAEMSEQEAAEKMHMVDAAMDATRRLSSAAFLVMYRLIDHGDYEAAPPPDEIAEEVHMSPRKVKLVMRELIDAGLIDERKLDDAGWINIDVGDFHHQEWIAGPNRNIWFEDREQFEEYSRDPEAWSAKYVGLSVEDYREWIRLKGRALCGATTKGGKPCRTIVYRLRQEVVVRYPTPGFSSFGLSAGRTRRSACLPAPQGATAP